MAIKKFSENVKPDESLNKVETYDFTDDEVFGFEQDGEMKVAVASEFAGAAVARNTINNLTSTDTDKALSANQGKILKDAQDAIKGTGWDGENLAEQKARIVSLEASAAAYDSVKKIITDDPMSEDALIAFLSSVDTAYGIYTVTTLRHGIEMVMKSEVTVENIETGLEEKSLKFSRYLANGTSFEWNVGLEEWLMSAGGGGGGGGGPTVSALRLYTYPLGIPTTLSAAANSSLDLSVQYQNGLTTNGVLRVYRNGVLLELLNIQTGVTTVDVGSNVKVGSNSFDFTVSDAFGNSQTITYLVTGVSVSITSAFNDAVVQAQTGSLLFNVVAGGERYVIRSLDGIESEVAAPTITNVFDWEDLGHGTHTLSLQAKSVLPSGQIIYSNTLEYLLITAEEGNTTPIIASKFDTSSAPEGSVLSVDYIAYVEGLEVVDVQFLVDGNQVGSASVDRSRKTWRVTNLGIGTHDLTIACGEVTRVHTVEITELDVEFANIEDSFLKLYLSAAQKTNADVTKEEWLPSYGDAVPVYLQNFNYQTNGWVDGGLVFNGLSSAIIVYKPFLSEVSMNGMTLEFEIETENTYGENTPFIRCMFNDRGIEIYSDRAIIKSSNSSAIAFFRENQRIKVSFVIDKAQNIILTYVNGVMTGLNRIAFDSFFVQNSPQNIEVNRNYVGGTLYSFRAYQRTLSPSEIMQNYLFDLPDLQTKLLEYNVSDIFDVEGEVDFDKLSARIPVMKIRAYDTDINGNYLPEIKDDKKRLFDVDFVNPFDHVKDFSAANVGIRTQGTSTLIYPVKNYRLYLPEGNDYSIDPNETRPTLILNIKTDYMESSLATNVGFCRLINDVLYDTPLPGQVADPLVRSSTYGYPIAVFLDDGNTVRFWGLYNLNTDKSDTQTFGFYDGNGFPESRKFENVRNVGNSAGAFIRKPELTDEEWFAEVVTDFEGNYPSEEGLKEATLENYQPLMDVVEFVSDYPGLDDPDIEAYKTEFAARIDVEYAIKYLLTCLVIGAVDSFGKDLMLNTWGVEGDYYKWYLTFYDLDTCVGIDNTGHMLETDGVTPKYDYDIELVDEGAFAQAESRLWDAINELFAEEVANYYATLRTGAFSFETLWHYLYDLQISKFSKGMYNANAIRKYIEAPGAEDWLHMLHGDRVDQMYRWLSNRLAFLDSKYGYNKDSKRIDFRLTTADASQIEFNLTTDLHQWVEVLVGNGASADSYGIARAKAGTPVAVGPNYASGVGLTFAEGSIFHAERITDLGDIGINSGFSLDELRIQDAVNLLRCDLGHDTPDSQLTTFTIGDNYNLEELNLRNNSSLSGLLDLSGCPSIRKLDLRGTNYTSVTFPEGGVLEECYLPATISTVVLYNQPYLNQETFTIEDGATIDYLRVENCPGLDIISILGKSSETVAVRILGLELSTYGTGTVDELVTLVASAQGIDINGNIVAAPALYGAITVWDFDDSVDVSVYAPTFPNIVFSEMTTNTDFVVSDELNSRGNCTLISYVGTDTIVEIPTAEYNAYLSETVPYVLGNYGWASIDEIGANAFGAGIGIVHLTEHIISVQNLGFSVAYTGVIVTELTAVPSAWNLSGKEVFLAQDNWELQDDLLLSVDANGVVLLRYFGADTEYALPTTITVDEVAKSPYSVSSDFFIEVANQITELHIPTNITIIGAGLTSNLHEDALIWTMMSAKPIGWHTDWNVADNTVNYNAPATKRTFNIYDGEILDTTLVEYGLLESDRVANAYGHGLYADELFNAEISYPYYGSGESNDLYMSLILAPVHYTYDAVDGGQYYVSGYDRTRLEGDGIIKLVIASTYNDGINGLHPVTYVAEDAIGHSSTSEASVLKEVVFQTNLNFKYNGYPEGMLGGATHLTTFVPPAGVTVIPNYFRANCQLLPMMSLDNVTSIGDYAFFENYQIEEIVVPDTVTYIGQNSFLCSISDNSSLMTVIMYASGATIGDTAFVVGNYFRDVYTVSDTGIYERQEDNTWIQVSELPIDEQYFTINESGLITSYDITGGTELVPPATVDGVAVVGYAAHALDGVDITTLYLGSNITYIGEYAFADTAIESVNIPNSVTYIGVCAFLGLSEADISLGTGVDSYVVYEDEGATIAGHISSFEDSSFTIPETVTKVKSYAFESSLIESLDIHAGVTVIEDRAFINSSYLSTISLYAERQNISLGSSLIIEGDNAFNTAVANEPSFNGRGVYEKQLDNSWLWIEEVWLYTWSVNDFLYGNNSVYLSVDPDPITLENFFPPESYINVVGINKVDKSIINIPHSIYGKQVYVQAWNFSTQQAVSDEMEELNFHPNTVPCQPFGSGTIGGKAYVRYLPSLDLPYLNALARVSGIPTILNSMASTFQNCKNLVSVTNIPNTVTSMANTFANCSKLINVPSIPNSVTNMSSTFRGCRNLINAPAIPNSVTNMYSTFRDCYNLINAPVIPNSVTGMTYTFSGCSSLINAPLIPNSVTDMASTFQDCYNLVNAPLIPNSVTSMSSTFRDCSNLVNAPVIPNSVTSMSDTFRDCRKLINVPVISNSITGMAYTFFGCRNLINVPAIPNSVRTMSFTFQYCTNLINAPVIPNSVTTMSSTFQFCSKLINVPVIPNSVTGMSSTFQGCSSLVNAPLIPNSVTSMSDTFSGCVNLVNAPIISNSVTDMFYTFRDCSNLVNAPLIPNSVINMAGTFYGCAKLINVPALPNSVTNMSSTFHSCSNLVNAPAIPNSVTDMSSTFSYCDNLVNVSSLPNSVTNMTATFRYCSKLINAPSLPNSVTDMVGTFYGCTNLINAPSLPNSVISMPSTFYNCTNLVNAPLIPNSVTNMYSTFQRCSNLNGDVIIYSNQVLIAGGMSGTFGGTNASLPKSVYMPYIGFNATHNTKAAADYSSIDGNDGVTIYPIPAGATLDDYAVYKTATVTEPMSVTGLAEDTIYTDALIIDQVNASKDWTVGVIPSTINGQQVFVTSNLFNVAGVNTVVEKITFDSGVRAINAYPAGTTQTSSMNFSGSGMFSKGFMFNSPITPNLKEVHGYPDTKSMSNAFANVISLISAPAIPANVTNMYSTFYNCFKLTSAPVIPNSVTDMYQTFTNCTSLTSPPVIPNSVTNMDYTFQSCSNLTSPPDMSNAINVTNMYRTFQSCSKLTSAPDMSNAINVTNMHFTFQSCSNFTSPPDMSNAINVTTMYGTFQSCSKLTSAPTIPPNVTDMSQTFLGCSNLTGDVIIQSNQVNIMSSCFSSTNALLPKSVYLPYTGYNATHNTYLASINASIDGKYGVTVMDINTYLG